MPPTDVEVPLSAGAPKQYPKANPRNSVVMFEIFHNVQYNVVQHKKYVKEMKKLYKKLNEDVFRDSFKNALLYLFTFGDTSANVDRVIQFVATFVTSLDDEEEFMLFIFEVIFESQCLSGHSVRYRSTQLLAAVLSALGVDASLDDDLCEKLLVSQMQRLQDTRGAVRCRAALALQRLQNPMDADDEVTRAYRFHMSCDPSNSVRRAIVMSIAKCTRNVPFVLERLCDVDEAVRRAAFLYISAMNVTQLRVKQRVTTLKVGLTERNPRVRRVVEEILIPGWLATFQGNIIDMLKAIRLDNARDAKDSQYVAGKLLESLFKRLPISELLEWLPTEKKLRLIPAEKLNKETAWYWRHLAQHLQKIDDDETLETVLPDLIVLTGYIRAIVESPCPSETDDPVGFSTRQHVLYELGEMLNVYDATDPASRSGLHQLITDVLTGDYGPLSYDVIHAYVSALGLVVPDVSARLEVISLVITSLRDVPEPEAPPLPPPPVVDCTEIKVQRARLRVSLNVAMEAQEEAVKEQNYALAAECKAKVAELQKKLEELNIQSAPPPPPPPTVSYIKQKSDAATLNKCLTILNCALDTPQLTTVTDKLKLIFKELEIEIFQNPDILENALVTVALYGSLDKDFAEEHKAFFFANLIDTTNEPIVCIVLRCIIDLLAVHGLRVFERDSETDTTKKTNNTTSVNNTVGDDGTLSESAMSITSSQNHNTVIEILLKIMDSACPTYRQLIVEGLCKLLYVDQLESPVLVSRLLLLWFNPATVEEDKLRQIIGMFFQTWVYNDGAQEQIQKATIPTLKTLANAPSSSPLAEVDQESVVRFIVSLTRVNHELVDSQGGMATVLCGHIARRPTAAETGLACRMLALLSPPRDLSLAGTLAATLRELCLKLSDKQSCRNLTRYLGALEATERASLNKMSQTGITEGTMQEDSLAPLGRTTSSLPQPIARSTHVVINETVEEEIEIDETSPTEVISQINEENPEPQPGTSSPKSGRNSSETDAGPTQPVDLPSDSSEGVSPVKKAKIVKGKKKKLSINKQSTESDSGKSSKGNKQPKRTGKGKSLDSSNIGVEKTSNKEMQEDSGGVKRTRSQRSLVDLERAKTEADKSKNKKDGSENKGKKPSPQQSPPSDSDSSNVTIRTSMRTAQSVPTTEDFDLSNVTIRTSIRRTQSGTSSDGSGKADKKGKKTTAKKKTTKAAASAVTKPARGSTGSNRSSAGSFDDVNAFDDSDESLHTIIYEKEFVQSVLNDSSELAENSKEVSKANVTIPETPEASDESNSEPEPEPRKGKKNGKKK